MTGFSGDDNIVRATLWMLSMLVVGVALLMIAFTLLVRGARWCNRPTARSLESRSNIGPQV